jgi:hypothetical protein
LKSALVVKTRLGDRLEGVRQRKIQLVAHTIDTHYAAIEPTPTYKVYPPALKLSAKLLTRKSRRAAIEKLR